MEKDVMNNFLMMVGIADDLVHLSEENYQVAKDYWKEPPILSKNMKTLTKALFLYTDKRRREGATNADA